MVSGHSFAYVPNNSCEGRSAPVPPFSQNEFILFTFSAVNRGTEHLFWTIEHLTGLGSLARAVINASIAVIDAFVTPKAFSIYLSDKFLSVQYIEFFTR